MRMRWANLVFAAVVAATTVTDDAAIASNKTFDFVIVGAGLAGITVANKLSGKGHSVLVVEAGPDGSWNPAVYNAEDRPYPAVFCNWNYPMYNEDGTKHNTTIDSGACIGGSTSINGMVWYRPTEAEINQLETLGNPGWNWATLEPLMKAIERNTPPSEAQIAQGAGYDPEVHGYHGLVNTSFPVPMRIPKAVELYKKALPDTFPGLTVGDDLSNRTSIVSASTSWTIWYDPVTGKNRRSSAADGLLWAPDQQRDTLTVLANHTVARVILDKHQAAKGVEFLTSHTSRDSRKYSVWARKSVIVSAGSLASAPILERSGIGRSDALAAAGIPQVVNLPGVGANLNDQPGSAASALIKKEYQNDTSLMDGRNIFGPEISLVNVDNIWGKDASEYIAPLVQAQALHDRARALVTAGAAVNTEGAARIMNATIQLITKSRLSVAEFIGESYPTVLNTPFWPLMPLSRGHIHIISSDPFQFPIITPRLLTDEFDRQVALGVARKSRELFASPAFADVVADAYYDPPIGPNGTDAQYLEWIEKTANGASHWLGSTSMLPRELGGVVDSHLRVYGTKNLHVVDAGIIPIPLTSHTMSTLYAVAQRAAQLILQDCK